MAIRIFSVAISGVTLSGVMPEQPISRVYRE
jgi:hypothetical protein